MSSIHIRKLTPVKMSHIDIDEQKNWLEGFYPRMGGSGVERCNS